MIARVHNAKGKTILAVCDSALLGKKFEDKNLLLDLTADYYRGEEMSEERIFALVRTASILSFIGKQSVAFAFSRGLISEASILRVKGIPHAQSVRA